MVHQVPLADHAPPVRHGRHPPAIPVLQVLRIPSRANVVDVSFISASSSTEYSAAGRTGAQKSFSGPSYR